MRISQNELERQRYLERQRAERDAASLAADARAAQEEARVAHQKGFDEGREKGFDEGREKGKRIGRIQLLQQFLAQPETSSEELDRLPEPDLVQLEESLKRQWSSPKQANGTPPADHT